jgi:hypothetical protein
MLGADRIGAARAGRKVSYSPANVTGVLLPLGTVVAVLLGRLPALAAVVTGLVLLGTGRRRLPARSVTLARAGLIVVLAEVVLSAIWAVVLPRLIYGSSGLGFRGYGVAAAAGGFLLDVVFGVGLVLVVAGLLAARRRDEEPPSFAHPQQYGG